MNTLTVPAIMVMSLALLLAAIILLALLPSKCFKSHTSVFYFNISLADAVMAAAGMTVLLIPARSVIFLNYQKLIFMVLR